MIVVLIVVCVLGGMDISGLGIVMRNPLTIEPLGV